MVAVQRRPYAAPWYDIRDYAPRVVTVPAPTVAPTLTLHDIGSSNFIDGHSYEFAYSYLGWSGESAVSPAVTVVQGAILTYGYVMNPKAPLGSLAACARIWSRDQAVAAAWRFSGGNEISGALAFGTADVGQVPGGLIRFPTTAGVTHPGADNAAHQDATVIAAPTLAPDVAAVGALPTSTTFYAAFTYRCEDGTQTALSPASAPITTPAAACSYLTVRIPRLPPSGAVFVHIYLSTDGVNWRRQKTNAPLGYFVHYVHTWDSAGGLSGAGACQSTISAFQQAWDAAMLAGGGCVVVPATTTETKVPIILRGYDANNVSRHNMRVLGLGGSGNNQGIARISYTGALSGVELVVSSASSALIENLAFLDPNSRASYGLVLHDYSGGGSFFTEFRNVSVAPLRPGSTGVLISTYGASPNQHIASEVTFTGCEIVADAWCFDIAGTQTVNLVIDTCRASVQNSQPANIAANSGCIKMRGGELRTQGRFNADGIPHYQMLLTSQALLTEGGVGGPLVSIEGWYCENVQGSHMIAMDGQVLSAAVSIVRSRFQNQRAIIPYFLFSVLQSAVSGLGNFSLDGHVWLAWPGDVPALGNNNSRFRVAGNRPSGSFKASGSPDQYAAAGEDAYYGVPIGLLNESGQESKIGTNAAGRIIVAQADAPILSTSATLPEAIAALQAAGWVRQS